MMMNEALKSPCPRFEGAGKEMRRSRDRRGQMQAVREEMVGEFSGGGTGMSIIVECD